MIRSDKKEPTMKDIALIVGVSQATVSYALNNSKSITKTVKKRILDVAKEIGYIPNAVARNLKKRRTNTIGIVVPDVMNSYYNEMIKHTEKIIREQGYFIFICYTMHKPDIEDWYIVSLIQQKVEGVIICYGLTNRECYKKLYKHNVPFVDIDDETDKAEGGAACVRVNHIKGSFLAVQHFISLGIKDIAYCSEPLYNSALRDRHEGFLRAIKEFGLTINNDMVYIANKENDYEKINLGYIATKEILSKSKPEGIFAATDQIAFGVIKRLNEMRIKIPNDIAVIGYDNVPFSSVISPSLTTVSQSIRTMCIQGAGTLFKIIKGDEDIENRIILEPDIVIRESAPSFD